MKNLGLDLLTEGGGAGCPLNSMFVRCRSVCVRPLSHEITTFWDLVNPYLVPESAFVLVSFWVILAQRI